MKELLLSVIFLTGSFVYSQEFNLEKCGFDRIKNELKNSDPDYYKKEQNFRNYLIDFKNNKSGAVPPYRIPVVVHVMHRGEAIGVGSNISDDDVKSAIRFLNERFRKSAGGVGDGAGVDTQIEFALAVRDESDNCTNGIVRFDMSGNSTFMTHGVRATTSNGITDGALMGLSRWDATKYYNMYTVWEIDGNECGSGVQGFAYPSGNHGLLADGAVMLSCTFGGSSGTTLTHELGHAMNLDHTFEGDGGGGFCPTNTNCNTQGDQCCDTPPHARSSSDCPSPYSNSCDGGSSSELFVHNYLDYSSDGCQSEFTADQATRMQAAITGTRASFLESNGNMSLVPPSAPTADFTSDASFVCSGSSMKFLDNSSCIPNTYENGAWTGVSFNWTFDDGTNPVTNSTLQNPTLTLATGTYDVSLQVTNGSGTNSITKNNFLVVGNSPGVACTPTSTHECNCAQTISNVTFNTINNSTSTIDNLGYTDYSCSHNTVVESGSSYNLSIDFNAGGSGGEVFEVYIDYNNNNAFEAGELVHSGSTGASTSNSSNTNITIPETAVKNTLLRMRVIGETGSISSSERACSAIYFIADVEDYGVYISNVGLPIDLVSFNAKKKNLNSLLEWEIESAKDFSHFEIEKSKDSKIFEKIGDIRYNEKEKYSFVDQKPYSGINYYRLKLVEKNEEFGYSDLKKIHFKNEIISIYPNPFEGEFFVNGLKEDGFLEIRNMLGQVLKSESLKSGTNSISTQNLPNGSYIVSIKTENNTFVEKLIKSTK